MQYRRVVSILISALMVVAVSSRLYLTHDREYYEVVRITKQDATDNGAWLICDCPICHAEDYVATEAEYFFYEAPAATLLQVVTTPLVASVNRVVILTQSRGPPALI